MSAPKSPKPSNPKPFRQSLLRTCAALSLATTVLAFQAPPGLASPAPREGTDYVQLARPVAQVPRDQVVEVFWYDCEHSYQLEQPLDDWAARQSPPVHILRIPALLPCLLPLERRQHHSTMQPSAHDHLPQDHAR